MSEVLIQKAPIIPRLARDIRGNFSRFCVLIHIKVLRRVTAQPLNQPIELLYYTELDGDFAKVFALAVALVAPFDAYFQSSHQQV